MAGEKGWPVVKKEEADRRALRAFRRGLLWGILLAWFSMFLVASVADGSSVNPFDSPSAALGVRSGSFLRNEKQKKIDKLQEASKPVGKGRPSGRDHAGPSSAPGQGVRDDKAGSVPPSAKDKVQPPAKGYQVPDARWVRRIGCVLQSYWTLNAETGQDEQVWLVKVWAEYREVPATKATREKWQAYLPGTFADDAAAWEACSEWRSSALGSRSKPEAGQEKDQEKQ